MQGITVPTVVGHADTASQNKTLYYLKFINSKSAGSDSNLTWSGAMAWHPNSVYAKMTASF